MRWAIVLVTMSLAGCLGGTEDRSDNAPAQSDSGQLVHDLLLPVDDAWYDVAYAGTYAQYGLDLVTGDALPEQLAFHTFDAVQRRIDTWNETHPGIVNVGTIATTQEGRPVRLVTLSDESVSGAKPVALFDGGHHGNEYAGAEVMLYLVDLLLTNRDHPVVRQWLEQIEIQIVPIVNPDGWVAATRYNANGVNLNRNYDIDWGNPLGTSNPIMGQLAAASGQGIGGIALIAENCGAAAFSEPESQAIRDWMESVADRAAFYLTGHTPTNAVVAPWAAYDPPQPVPSDHAAAFDAALGWIGDHTQYEAGYAGWGRFDGGLPYAFSGSSMDWFYATHGKPAFTVEVEWSGLSAGSADFPTRLLDEVDSLDYWMQETIPIHLHLLANWNELATWRSPDQVAPGLDSVLPDLDWSDLPRRDHAVH